VLTVSTPVSLSLTLQQSSRTDWTCLCEVLH